MAFKHNIPLPALLFGLIALVLAGLVFFHTPPDEDLLRQAADKYVATLGPVKQIEMHGTVADILAGDGRSVFAEFEKKNGTWTYARDLAEEFAKAMKEPDVQTTVLRHLGEKISQRFQSTVTFHENLREFRYDLARDLGTEQLIGSCSVKFAYPKVADSAQRGGLYVESFEWKDGAWRSSGAGTLYDAMPPQMMDLRDLLARYHAERGGSVAETAEGVRELSDMFNGLTRHRPGYLSNPKLRRAYVHYYLTVNAEKVTRVLRELDFYAPKGRPPRVLDFGCGPGTAAIATLLQRPVAELCLVDVVDEALDDARFFCRELGVEPRTMHEIPHLEKFDLILAANVYSEHLAPLEERLADDGYLVVIEPALKTATQKLMKWRDDAVARGFKVAAPCLGQTKCPMLERDDLWCHQDVSWPRTGPVAEIDRRLGLNKESLKYSYVVLTKTGRTLADLQGDVRVVSNLHKEKGKAWAWVCGRQGPLCRAEVLSRHRSDATAAFFHADRGHVLSLKVEGEFCRSEGPISRLL